MMVTMRRDERYAPVITTGRVRWWTVRGALYLGLRAAWRYYITGRELRGPGDNATFWHDATEDYRHLPVERLTRARWRRVSRRWIASGIPLLLLGLNAAAGATALVYGLFGRTAPVWTRLPYGWLCVVYVALALAAGVAIGASLLASWWRTRELRQAYIIPAAKVLMRATGVPMRRKELLTCIELPPGFGQERDPNDGEPEPARVYLPEVALDPRMKTRIAETVGARLGLPHPRAVWTESGVTRRFVDLYPQPNPPVLSIESLREELAAGDMEHPLIGNDAAGNIIRMDFHNDSPHTLGSAASGAGKSTLYKLIAMQRLHLGAYAVILDFKKWSHLRWAGRLPAGRVLIEDAVPRIHDTLGKILDELVWRKSFNLDQEDELAKLPTLDVYVEEINTLMSLLVAYWSAEVARRKQEARTALRKAKLVGDEDLIEEAEEMLAEAMGLPRISPAIQAIRYGVNLGREFRVHFHFIGQSIDAIAAGGRNTRESFRTRLLARWDAKTWKMLADGIPFVACPSTEPGVWAHVHTGTYEIIRAPFVPDAWAVEYVLAGRTPELPMFHGDPRPSIRPVDEQPAIAASATLREIVDLLPLKADGDRMTLKALRHAAGRDGFPDPIEQPAPGTAALYATEEIIAWFRERERLPAVR